MEDDKYNRLEDKMDKLFDRLDQAHSKMDEKLDRIEIAVATNTSALKTQQKQLDIHDEEFKSKLVPVYNRYQQLIGVGKVVGGAAVAFGLIEGFLKLFL
jgi:hypothetical protein